MMNTLVVIVAFAAAFQDVYGCGPSNYGGSPPSPSQFDANTPPPPPPPPVRLVGGGAGNTMQGTVEVELAGVWHRVCSKGWQDVEATVVCEELGYSGPARALRNAFFTQSPGLPWGMNAVACRGEEASLLDCAYRDNYVNCQDGDEAGVICDGAPINDMPIRLTGAPEGSGEGNVEIQLPNGRWTRACDSGWGDIEANILCNQLGHGDGFATRRNFFQTSNDDQDYLFDRVRCTDADDNIFGCERAAQARSDCRENNEAGVICSTAQHPVRLAGGSSTAGRVEVKVGGVWKQVCSTRFDQTTAQVVCDQLNTEGVAERVDAAPYGSSSEGFLTFSCKHGQSEIFDCLRMFPGDECDGPPAAVSCNHV